MNLFLKEKSELVEIIEQLRKEVEERKRINDARE